MNLRQEKKSMKPKKNIWKYATFLLLGIIIGSLSYFLLLSFTPQKKSPVVTTPDSSVVQQGETILTLKTNKEKVNQLIAHFLKEYLNESKIKYQFSLENQALLQGTFQVLGHPLNFYLYFDPLVLENGNIQLQAKSISIGSLGIPIKEVLSYAKKNFKLPDWVTIQPKEASILLNLNELKLTADLKVKATEINLVDDEIQFDLYLKEKNRG